MLQDRSGITDFVAVNLEVGCIIVWFHARKCNIELYGTPFQSIFKQLYFVMHV